MSDKIDFTNQLIDFTDFIGVVADNIEAIEKLYFSRSYQFGGNDPITDEEIAPTNRTANDVSATITFLQEFNKLLNNAAPTTGDYLATISTMRKTLPGSRP